MNIKLKLKVKRKEIVSFFSLFLPLALFCVKMKKIINIMI